MPDSEHTVADLAVAARAGDNQAWLELLARFDGMVRAITARYRLRDADAADAVQATWLSAFEQIGRLRQPERFGGWLRAIARNECRDTCARADREHPSEDLDDTVVETSAGPDVLVLRADCVRAVREAVAELPRHSRVLVECLFFAPQTDYAFASKITGMPVGGIGPTRGRVLLVLRNRLAWRGYGPAHEIARAG